ncbi:MAG: DUF898 domain-containing protein [Burkholderiales bacterium]|nr:DUF898 domain-containing protein [Burkholderiales bacterium]
MTSAAAAESAFPSFSNEQNFAPEQPAPRTERLTFTGSGSEYFRIWIVNLLLTILTLGIYSAWAKVRRMRYFYDNTHLAGSSFEYHGNPVSILKGRIIAVGMLGAYNALLHFSVPAALVLLLVIVGVGPWLAWKSLQFKLFNSGYRGIRFGFRGSLGRAYTVFLLLPLAAPFTLYFLVPLVHQQIKQFQHEESRYGSTYFSFHAGAGKFYVAYGIMFLLALGGLTAAILVGLVAGFGIGSKEGVAIGITAGVIVFYLWMFMLFPTFLTMIQRVVWNGTKLGTHQFQCDMEWKRMTFIMVTNLLGIIFTFGLFTPFAKVRAMRYRLESMSMVSTEDIDSFVADNLASVSAAGEGMADILDFDLSL